MAWIESHQELAGHPKTKRLARALGESIPSVIGRLHMLWWWALNYAQEGDLSGFEPEDIADAVMWDGDANCLVEAMVTAGFIDRDDSGTHIHDWWNYAGKLVEQRQKDAERKRVKRSKTGKRPTDVRRTSQGHPDGVRGASECTVPNRTVPNQEINSSNVTQVPECDREEPGNLVPPPPPMPQTSTMDHAGQEVEIRMMQHMNRQFIVKANDFTELKKLMASQVPLEFILTGIDRAFERNPGISSFAYCSKVIADLWAAELAKQANVTPIDFTGRGSRDGPDGARVSKGLPEEAEVFKRYVDAAAGDTS